jgi:NAD(P)-dependent dehydrogenase (short-subunit alcohol dehydrogenase family)
VTRLDGAVAVITGGGRGIGRAIATRYAAEGAHVVVSSRTPGDLHAVLAAIAAAGGRAAHHVVADATDRADARRPIAEALEHFGQVDIVVNNVGGSIGNVADPFTMTDEDFEATIRFSLLSGWWTTQAALPSMRRAGFGRVIFIGSGASRMAVGSIGYTTAKHGMVGLTRELAKSVAPFGINVNCLCPGWTNTSRVDFERIGQAEGTDAGQAREKYSAKALQNRVLEPEELTGMAVLLASEDGKGITGQVINVDGGFGV